MNSNPPKVLLVDDEENILRTMNICLTSIGYQITTFTNPQTALEVCRKEEFDLAFIDLKMAPIDGMEMFQELKKISPLTTVIIITAHGSIDSAVEAIKKGAFHYLQKPFDYKELQLFAQRTYEYHCLTKEVKQLRQQLAESWNESNFVTRNKTMQDLLTLAKQVAESNITVLLEGESGTGKDVIAHFIHQKSFRSQKAFVHVNCGALPDDLLESELFGHVRGAFTGALKDRQGRFELADGGTIFLDEIAEVSPRLQVKLLRVIQNKEFERVGESVTRKVDVRIIAATNRNLDEALKEGAFREDLFYRLSVVRLKLLPLRERLEDIPILIQHFITKFTKQEISLSADALRAFQTYRWSGNVRELENVLERAILLAKLGIIEVEHLPEELRAGIEKSTHLLSLEEMEKVHIKRVLQYAKDYEEAATILMIDPATLWRKRKKYSL